MSSIFLKDLVTAVRYEHSYCAENILLALDDVSQEENKKEAVERDDIEDNMMINSEDEGRNLIPLQSIPTGAQFACQLCEFTAGTKRSLERHHDSLHSDRNVVCGRSFCTQEFQTKFTMLAHMASCFINCEWQNCSQKFRYRKRYEAHQRSHRNEKRRFS